jgi:hypothetical protein
MNPAQMITYTNQVMKLIREVTTQIALLKFRTFQDSHDMSKIMRANIASIAEETAIESERSFNKENIYWESLLFTKDFYNAYIVETSIIVIKSLFEKEIVNYIED